jgi:MYXO-CTERM domain-containing protein
MILLATATVVAMADPAHAFCGFYVSGGGKKMFNDATNVVLVRDGTRTVLSMQNDYRGPLEDFAMVIPVPVVLKDGDVKVLPKPVLERIDALGAPRLVEYWEQDPCPKYERNRYEYSKRMAKPSSAPMADMPMSADSAGGGGGGGGDYVAPRPVAPILASFNVDPPAITANTATEVSWTFGYANAPYPDPSCTVDNGVGRVTNGMSSKLNLKKSTNFTLTCANSAGKSTKQFKVNVVTIEAKFDVAEYQILILSAAEATGLDQWLKLNGYKIPADAEALLRPYVESGSKFFVAKVNPKKVQMVDGRAALSPLRFHYEHEEFSLPIRLGLANSSGVQDLIVNIISKDSRYEVANYKNVTIPTNFDVKDSVRTRFGEFYAALFDKTIASNPGAVVTEYAWTAFPQSMKCDPCPPGDMLATDADMMALGGDIVGGSIAQGGFVLTRLHARYRKGDVQDDLIFRTAGPILGGREFRNAKNQLEYGSIPAPNAQNFFQARYAIRHWWTGPMTCKNPRRGIWGGPPDGRQPMIVAKKTAFAPRGKMRLPLVVKRDIPEIRVKKYRPPIKPITPTPSPSGPTKTQNIGAGALLLLLGALAVAMRRRRATP